MKKKNITRRRFMTSAVAATAGGVVAFQSAAVASPAPYAKTARYADYLPLLDDSKNAALAEEPLTERNMEGPFYRAGAPFRNKLYDDGEPGKVLVVSGSVVSRNGRPLADAVLDLWQASAAGRYDNDDARNPPKRDEFKLRGKVKTDKDGKYSFETIWPAAYGLGGNVFRPAHIHLKVNHEGHKTLTTQIYFKGDKYNATDGAYRKSLEIDPKPDGKKLAATFKIVLAKA
jgi:protocatechuate 3,4-dioxygenase beta subunit